MHTCSESRRTFLTSFISGMECEDVHPSERCKASCCAHHSSEESTEEQSDEGVKFCKKNCCSNDYQQIELTGSGDASGSERSVDHIALVALCVNPSFDYQSVASFKMLLARKLPDCDLYMGELRPLLSVWRI